MKNQKEFYLLTQGKQYFDNRQFELAKKHFLEIIEDINPSNTEALYYLANIFAMNSQISKAIKAYRKLLKLDPGHTDASIALSILLNDIGEYEEAKNVFVVADKKLKSSHRDGENAYDPHVNKKFAFKHFELGDLYLSYDRYDEALFEYEKSLRLDSSNTETQIQISKVYAKKGFFAKAIELLKKVKNENPSALQARIALGVLYYGNGNIIEAQSEWNLVCEKDPGNTEAKMYLNLSQSATETKINF